MESHDPILALKAKVEKNLSDISQSHGFKSRKLVLMNFTEIPPLPKDFKEVEWGKLEAAVKTIFSKIPCRHSLQELYKSCESLCILGHGSFMHEQLHQIFDLHVIQLLENLRRTYTASLDFVVQVQTHWVEFIHQMSLIRSIFTYMDRAYALPTEGVTSIWDMGLNLFRCHVLEAPDVRKQTMEIILDRIGREREGELVDRKLIQSLLRMIHDLGLYDKEFEVQLLTQVEVFYRSQASTLLPKMNLEQHVTHVEQQISQEESRIQSYLARTTGRPLLDVVYTELIVTPAPSFPAKGFTDALYRTPNVPLLGRLYNLFEKAEALPLFNTMFYEEILILGKELIKDPGQDRDMIQNITNYRETLLKLVQTSFNNTVEIQRMQTRAFEVFMASRGSMPAKLLAKSIDLVLRTGNTRMTDVELDNKLDQMFQLFRFIQGKDVFEAFYKQSLAKRLLLSRSASYDSERVMISKLKRQLGTEYTDKLEGMFRDMELSDELTKQYNDKRLTPLSFDLTVNVLTQAYWPTYSPALVQLPGEMEKALVDFYSFYNNRHSGRRLFWQPGLSKCSVIATYAEKAKEFVASLYQAMVLLLFNDTDQLTLRAIREATGLDSELLKPTLLSMSTTKVNILIRQSSKGTATQEEKLNEDEVYRYNPMFRHTNVRIKINALQLKETVRGDNKIQEMVIHNRMFLIDALVVRLLKTKQRMKHLEVMTEALRLLNFPVDPQDVKARIDNLMEREFIERDEHDPEVIIYVA
ncbi:Cullin-4A [Entomophthora muscae]|uniref:Cullin-4A n=2 Tax=Entomophthora muscae TaxID=34485 RepID=A0ACC2UFS2_9FUNG|nr:Cullin-4A [Entomophthora muscae]